MNQRIVVPPATNSTLPDNAEIERLAQELCTSGTTTYRGQINTDTVRFLFHEVGHKLSTADHDDHDHLPLRGHAWLEDSYHLYTKDGWQAS